MYFRKLLFVPFILIFCVFLNGCGRSSRNRPNDDIQINLTEKEEPNENKRMENKPDILFNPIIDIKRISLKNDTDVEKILGKPDSTTDLEWSYFETDEIVDNCFINKYKDGLIRVFYIEGIAGIIEVTPEDKIPLSDDMSSYLSLIGLEAAQPQASNEYGYYWSDVNDICEVRLIHEDNYISFIEIIVDRKYKHF